MTFDTYASNLPLAIVPSVTNVETWRCVCARGVPVSLSVKGVPKRVIECFVLLIGLVSEEEIPFNSLFLGMERPATMSSNHVF